jgi:hypothetical protein
MAKESKRPPQPPLDALRTHGVRGEAERSLALKRGYDFEELARSLGFDSRQLEKACRISDLIEDISNVFFLRRTRIEDAEIYPFYG